MTDTSTRHPVGARSAAIVAAAATVLSVGLSSNGCAVDTGEQAWDATGTGIDPGSCPGGRPHLVDGRPATWTVLHYAAADNNLEKVIVGDIDEMELGHQGSRNVNVIVQLDKRSEAGRWRYRIEPDREAAIHKAVRLAREGDTLLLAGRGHETHQLIGSRRIPFDDREVLREALRKRKMMP